MSLSSTVLVWLQEHLKIISSLSAKFKWITVGRHIAVVGPRLIKHICNFHQSMARVTMFVTRSNRRIATYTDISVVLSIHPSIHPSIYPSIHPLLHGLSARRCPMSPHFLTRWVSRLLGLALVSWAFACVAVHASPFPLPFIFRCFLFTLLHRPLDFIRLFFTVAVFAPHHQPSSLFQTWDWHYGHWISEKVEVPWWWSL